MAQVRLAKYIASSGLYSRREAEDLVLSGKVKVNGEIYRDFLLQTSENLLVQIEERIIKPNTQLAIYKFHKIPGTVTTSQDPQNRVTIYDSMRKNKRSFSTLKTVGRLDYNTEGLLILTSQGQVARALELPMNNFERVYEVEIWGSYGLPLLMDSLSQGLIIEDIKYKSIVMEVLRSNNNNHRIQLTLKEGKNREIRRILAYFGFKIKSLKRIKFGPIELNDLKKEEIRELSPEEYFKIKNLLKI